MEVPRDMPATPVQTHNTSPDANFTRVPSAATNFYHRSLFPGNAGLIDYTRLGRRRQELDHTTTQITSAVGSVVGLHEFPGQNRVSDIIVVMAHGNTRSTRYMNDLVPSLLECGVKAVVGRDFVGYDSSSAVPYQNGAVEIAAHANDAATMQHLSEKYPDARFVLCGRSIGTFFWTGQLHHPKVVGAIGIVPLSRPSSLLKKRAETAFPSLLYKVVGASNWESLSHTMAKAALPSGYISPDLTNFTTRGFELAGFPDGVEGKSVVLFPAIDDELIPEADAKELHQMLEQAGCRVATTWTKGDHRTMPTQPQLADALHRIIG